jgi:uncharacterized oxidoreductase
MNLYDLDDIENCVSAIFRADGAEDAEARSIARHLCSANLAGHESHGLLRVPLYLQWRQQGRVHYKKQPEVIKDQGAWAWIHGNGGFGQCVGEFAVDFGVGRARELGTCIVMLKSSGHLGRLGGWAERAAESGVVSIHFLNSPGRGGIQVAPAGAREARIAPNPVAVGIPQRDGHPLVLDITASVIPEGKVKAALHAGTPLPPDAVLDHTGQVTRDPRAFYGPPRGALLPAAGHKGAGLCFMIDLLAGALTGGGISHPDMDGAGNNMLSIYIDPQHGVGQSAFETWAADLGEWVRSAAPLNPGADSSVLAPGDREAALTRKRRREGVPLDEETRSQLQKAAHRFRIPFPSPKQAPVA